MPRGHRSATVLTKEPSPSCSCRCQVGMSGRQARVNALNRTFHRRFTCPEYNRRILEVTYRRALCQGNGIVLSLQAPHPIGKYLPDRVGGERFNPMLCVCIRKTCSGRSCGQDPLLRSSSTPPSGLYSHCQTSTLSFMECSRQYLRSYIKAVSLSIYLCI